MSTLSKIIPARLITRVRRADLFWPVQALAEGETGSQILDQAANDPSTSIMNVQIQNVYVGDYHELENVNADFNVNFRVAVYAPTGSYKVGLLANTGKNFCPRREPHPGLGAGVYSLLEMALPWGYKFIAVQS